ncbi:formylglycine-generating enzyme family protein [Marichromatium purpuratum]|uniref:formylglycine-generating enzyme family protein n=1 Tax=Marichromatium purpuratum TaxID=37487 RepID=UPI00021E7516|nr:formylglycine-generating enzyme family protein [Marichromatium purpuratum]
MAQGLVSRGDLLRALCAEGCEPLTPAALHALGYDEPEPKPKKKAGDASESATDHAEVGTEPPAPARAPLRPATFWVPFHLASDEILLPGDQPRLSAPALPSRPAADPSPYRYLTDFAQLVPRLRRVLTATRPSRAYDLDRIVHCMGRGEWLRRLPRRHRAGWGPSLYVIEDRCDHLAPYVRDQAMVQTHLQRLFPTAGFRTALYSEHCDRPQVHWPDGEVTPIAPQPGDQVLVLGDLGCLARDGGRAARFWRDFGDELELLGVSALVLLPCAPADAEKVASPHFQRLCWEHPAPSMLATEALQTRGERLLARMSIASRIEPGLLRELRLGLGDVEHFPARLEAWVWQEASGKGAAMIAAALPDADAEAWRAKLGEGDDSTCLGRLVDTARDAMRHLPYEVWLETVLNVAERAPHAISDEERNHARELLQYLADRASSSGAMSLSPRAWDWLSGFFERLDASVKENPFTKDACWGLACALADTDRQPLPPPSEQPLPLDLCQLGDRVHSGMPPGASPLARLHTRDQNIQVRVVEDAFWESGKAPPWATDWGWDAYGAWVEFAIEDKDGQPVTQRMRWIEPGCFWMGSPDDEPGRDSDEGPRHEVTIQEGFWLFETACTQALWEAVTGENPSFFKGLDRPVEQVSWDDVQGLVETINARLPGLALSLPSEAQWEYACRVGSDTAFSFGETITPEQVNYDGNYPYAGGAKGLDRQETVPVKALPPNGWGLYQMHGNVWEWVQDAWHDTYKGAPIDGSAWESAESGAGRVIRGGSWLDVARYCRSAHRYWFVPVNRNFNLGFRCARVQVRESGTPEAERVELARPGPRSGSGRGETAPSRAAGQGHVKPQLLRLDTTASASVELPDAPGLEIRSDREVLRLQRCAMPDWAKAMGRDRFGLWAEIHIEPVTKKEKQRRRWFRKKAPQAVPENVSEPFIQRLRWIPPGRFLMGSPEDEPGRRDSEGPQHVVTVGQGFWLFDTPCTQALWIALGLENPSRFQDPARPVEQVTWDDIQQQFLPALNERIPGFILPSEAQWEYACRAGTQTALYSGPIEIRGDMDAPDLDPIGWYGGNSGVNYDLADGEDTTSGAWWSGKQKQYPHERAGTRQVKGKLPNPWGLYDMFGNVWEWTQDAWHDSYEGAPLDGSAWESAESGALRVIRGGSWVNLARGCRSAYRNRFESVLRDDDLGFRCARVQVL